MEKIKCNTMGGGGGGGGGGGRRSDYHDLLLKDQCSNTRRCLLKFQKD